MRVRFILGASLLAVAVAAGAILWNAGPNLGRAASGTRAERMHTSPQWNVGNFENPQPLYNDAFGMLLEAWNKQPHGAPDKPLPLRKPNFFGTNQGASPLRVTWLGHSTSVIQMNGQAFLTDPVWGERCSPVTWLGPKRFYPPIVTLTELPRIDAVLISHDHYDHLDAPTIRAMSKWDTVFIAPLGVGAHLESFGVPSARIIELDWWEEALVGGTKVVATPARHASGRHLFDQNRTLWAGYAILGNEQRVYFSGDTGLFPGLKDIGARLGPFDVTMIEVGAYGQSWPDWHLGPEQAVRAHQWVRGAQMIPIHWGLFDLAYHGWTEPVVRTQTAALAQGVRLQTPRPGDTLTFEAARHGDLTGAEASIREPLSPETSSTWWPHLPTRDALAYPIVATKVP